MTWRTGKLNLQNRKMCIRSLVGGMSYERSHVLAFRYIKFKCLYDLCVHFSPLEFLRQLFGRNRTPRTNSARIVALTALKHWNNIISSMMKKHFPCLLVHGYFKKDCCLLALSTFLALSSEEEKKNYREKDRKEGEDLDQLLAQQVEQDEADYDLDYISSYRISTGKHGDHNHFRIVEQYSALEFNKTQTPTPYTLESEQAYLALTFTDSICFDLLYCINALDLETSGHGSPLNYRGPRLPPKEIGDIKKLVTKDRFRRLISACSTSVPSTIMLAVAEGILCTYAVVKMVVYLRHLGQYLPKLPTSIAFIIALFVASVVVQDDMWKDSGCAMEGVLVRADPVPHVLEMIQKGLLKEVEDVPFMTHAIRVQPGVCKANKAFFENALNCHWESSVKDFLSFLFICLKQFAPSYWRQSAVCMRKGDLQEPDIARKVNLESW
ncbi:uncharacterized protein BDR25DRAFT_363607 [Lindgomyces ingoldianus]|uniref:Uncharacterized protein n=1 Tax=Lindgomyces ingoldianus TaxID=673940 RepID=A0ACB6Q7H2_9PLEO|nr:uncharacterized protein BDR25DRAFT_363607 [Lindgomyces ingoldianus]KAF2462774.1 hypothetical protein BDR25DRAFT_363607 [Lindgomyces ingoldianus]